MPTGLLWTMFIIYCLKLLVSVFYLAVDDYPRNEENKAGHDVARVLSSIAFGIWIANWLF